MFVNYRYCRASLEGDKAGYVVAYDYIAELNELECATLLLPSECLWIVPGSLEGDAVYPRCKL